MQNKSKLIKYIRNEQRHLAPNFSPDDIPYYAYKIPKTTKHMEKGIARIDSFEEYKTLLDLGAKTQLILSDIEQYIHKTKHHSINSSTLDILAKKLCLSSEIYPACLGFDGFPAFIAINPNDTVAHGLPSKKMILSEGDIVGLDIITHKGGVFVDCAKTISIGKTDPIGMKLIQATRDALYHAIEQCKPGASPLIIGEILEKHALENGFSCADDLSSHFILHQPHGALIPNYVNGYSHAKKQHLTKMKFSEGMVFTIEPIFNIGKSMIINADDGFGYLTADGSWSAHFEHTIIITESGCQIVA